MLALQVDLLAHSPFHRLRQMYRNYQSDGVAIDIESSKMRRLGARDTESVSQGLYSSFPVEIVTEVR